MELDLFYKLASQQASSSGDQKKVGQCELQFRRKVGFQKRASWSDYMINISNHDVVTADTNDFDTTKFLDESSFADNVVEVITEPGDAGWSQRRIGNPYISHSKLFLLHGGVMSTLMKGLLLGPWRSFFVGWR